MQTHHFTVYLSEKSHRVCIARFRCHFEVLVCSIWIHKHSSSSLEMQLTQTNLGLYVAFLRQKLIVVNEIIVEDTAVRAGILNLIQKSNSKYTIAASKGYILGDFFRNHSVLREGIFTVWFDSDSKRIAIA